jgi:hypothetical protein
MILTKRQYTDLQKGVKEARTQPISFLPEYRPSVGDYLYVAKVTLSTNTASGSTATVWVYQADILWSQYDKTDLDAWQINSTRKAGQTDLLLSSYDLSVYGSDVVYVPCVQRGIYFENAFSTGTGGWNNGPNSGEGSGPWWITISGDTITCSDCVYMRGPVTLEPSVASLTLALTDDAYIAGHINLEYGTAVLFEGNSLQAVTDIAPQDDDTVYKLPLYRLHKVGDSWGVKMDYRAVPQLGVRL